MILAAAPWWCLALLGLLLLAAAVQDMATLKISNLTNGAILLHWLMAALVLVQVWIGFTFHAMPRGPERSDLFLWHKTVGATILVP